MSFSVSCQFRAGVDMLDNSTVTDCCPLFLSFLEQCRQYTYPTTQPTHPSQLLRVPIPFKLRMVDSFKHTFYAVVSFCKINSLVAMGGQKLKIIFNKTYKLSLIVILSIAKHSGIM